MQTLAALRRQIDTVRELETVVRTMKALSGATIRQYEQAVLALADYYHTVELGLYAVLYNQPTITVPRPSENSAIGFILLGSDQGLCGRFNELVSEYVEEELKDFGTATCYFLVMGHRLLDLLQQQGHSEKVALSVPGSVHSISATVERMLVTIDNWQTRQGVHQIWLYYNRSSSQALLHPRRVHLLPLQLASFRHLEQQAWPGRGTPLFTIPRKKLLSALIRQYFFVTLFRACAESLAAEHAARLAAMQRASKNIDEHLQYLNRHYQQQRQNSITEELLDVVAGYEVLTQADKC